MRTRRGFLASLVALAVAPFARRPLFVGHDVVTLHCTGNQWVAIPQRKMMARIRITEEALEDFDRMAFQKFIREDAQALARDIDRVYMETFK